MEIWNNCSFRRMDRKRALSKFSFCKRVRFVRNTKWSTSNHVWVWNGLFLFGNRFCIPSYNCYHHWIFDESSRSIVTVLFYFKKIIQGSRKFNFRISLDPTYFCIFSIILSPSRKNNHWGS